MPGISNSLSPQLCLVPLTSPQDIVYIGDGNEAGRDLIGVSSSSYYQGKLDLHCLLLLRMSMSLRKDLNLNVFSDGLNPLSIASVMVVGLGLSLFGLAFLEQLATYIDPKYHKG